jgi:hypothetical protein
MSVVLGLNLKKKPPPYAKVCGWLYNKGLVMPQVYNTTSTKASRKNEKNSEKESLDNKEVDISEKEVKQYRGHARNIPAHISDDNSLTDAQKMLYGLLEALSHHPDHFGYCFATNDLLCKITNKEKRTLQRNLEKLHKKGLIIVEISQEVSRQSIRRIWTLEHFAIRDRLEKIYGKDKFNQRFYIHVKNDTPPCQNCHPYIGNKIRNIRNNTKKPTPPAEAIIPLFCYEWKNKSTGAFEKIENGVTPEEFERLKVHIGEPGIRSVCNKMKEWADNSNGKVLFKNRNLYKKILEWSRRASLAVEEKAQKKKEKSLREEEKPEKPQKEKCVEEAETFIEEFIKENSNLADGIKWHKELNCVKIRSLINERLFETIPYPAPAFYERLLAWGRAMLIKKRNRGQTKRAEEFRGIKT